MLAMVLGQSSSSSSSALYSAVTALLMMFVQQQQLSRTIPVSANILHKLFFAGHVNVTIKINIPKVGEQINAAPFSKLKRCRDLALLKSFKSLT